MTTFRRIPEPISRGEADTITDPLQRAKAQLLSMRRLAASVSIGTPTSTPAAKTGSAFSVVSPIFASPGNPAGNAPKTPDKQSGTPLGVAREFARMWNAGSKQDQELMRAELSQHCADLLTWSAPSCTVKALDMPPVLRQLTPRALVHMQSADETMMPEAPLTPSRGKRIPNLVDEALQLDRESSNGSSASASASVTYNDESFRTLELSPVRTPRPTPRVLLIDTVVLAADSLACGTPTVDSFANTSMPSHASMLAASSAANSTTGKDDVVHSVDWDRARARAARLQRAEREGSWTATPEPATPQTPAVSTSALWGAALRNAKQLAHLRTA